MGRRQARCDLATDGANLSRLMAADHASTLVLLKAPHRWAEAARRDIILYAFGCKLGGSASSHIEELAQSYLLRGLRLPAPQGPLVIGHVPDFEDTPEYRRVNPFWSPHSRQLRQHFFVRHR